MKVLVLHSEVPEGAAPDEEDTLVQANAVSAALEQLGHDPVRMPFSMNLEAAVKRIRDERPDVVFNLVETVVGTGRFIHFSPQILEYLKIPFTGSGADALFTTSNKVLAKTLLQRSGIPTPRWVTADSPADPGTPPAIGSFIVKSVWEHASIGLDADSIIAVSGPGDLPAGIESGRGRAGGECFAELFVEGREFNVSLLGGGDRPDVLPIAEIRFEDFPSGKPRVVDYRAKWDVNSFEFRHTPRSFEFPETDLGLLQRLGELSRSCWELFGLRGYARVDFRVDGNGLPWVLEVNSNPCLSPDAGFVAACERAGLDFCRVIERILMDVRVRCGSMAVAG